MPSAPITGTPIRLQVSTASAPPVPPIDINTGLPPAQWRANSVSYQVGVFDVNGVSVDLSNFTYLQLTVATDQNAPTNLITATVLAANITPTISKAEWLAGTVQNASFNLSAAQTDVTLFAQPSQVYWLQLSGVTSGGSLVVLGAGEVTFYNAGSATPGSTGGQTDFNAQTNAGGNGSINPTSQLHTEQITFTGSAGTRIFPVTASAGNYAGAIVNIALLLPATPGILIQFTNQTLGGQVVASILTDGYTSNAALSLYLDGSGNYQPLSVLVPAH